MAQTLHAAGCSSGWLSKARCMVRAAAPYLRIAFIRSADSVPRAEPPRRNWDANRLACGTHARRAATATSKASACAAWPRVRWNGDAPSSGEEGGGATIPDEIRRARRTVANYSLQRRQPDDASSLGDVCLSDFQSEAPVSLPLLFVVVGRRGLAALSCIRPRVRFRRRSERFVRIRTGIPQEKDLIAWGERTGCGGIRCRIPY